jgi:DNA-binding GntR family transcriptional regulator
MNQLTDDRSSCILLSTRNRGPAEPIRRVASKVASMKASSGVLAKVTPVSIRAQVTTQLRDAILSGRLNPGERLIERKLAEAMGVSQAAVREGLVALEYEGLITRTANTATHVTQFTPERAKEIVQIRLQLEPFAMVQASRRLTPATTQEIQGLLEEMERGRLAGERYRTFQLDFDFHRKTWELSGNESLARVMNQLCTPLFAFFEIMEHANEITMDDCVRIHQVLLDVLVAGDPPSIEKASRAHILNAWYPPPYAP